MGSFSHGVVETKSLVEIHWHGDGIARQPCEERQIVMISLDFSSTR